MSTSKSSEVSRHTVRCISPVSVVLQYKLVSGWGLLETEIGATLFLFSSAAFRVCWMELDQNRTHAWKWVQFENACLKAGLSPHSTNRGPQNHLFWRFWNLVATLAAYVFRTKHDVHKWVSALKTTRGLLHRLKMTWTYGPQTTSNWRWVFTHFP